MYLNNTIETAKSQEFLRKISNEEYRKSLHEQMRGYLSQAFLEKFLSPEQRIIRFESCGDTIIEDNGKIVGANYCKNRLCPVCAYHRSIRCFAETKSMIEDLKDCGYKYLFATFTIRNMESLSQGINDCINGFYQLQHQRQFKKSFRGCIRTLEISYNSKDNTFHPHIHAILAVSKDYFDNPKLYIEQDKLCAMWKTACKLDYTPICDIRLIKGTDKAIAEVSKYTVKPLEVLEHDTKEQTYIELYNATYGRRLRAEIGCFRKAKQRVKKQWEENKEPIKALSENATTYIYSNNKYIPLTRR